MKGPSPALIAVLPNRVEPLSIAIKSRELAVLSDTFAILRATFQACVVVIGERVSLYCRHWLVRCHLVRMLASMNRFLFFCPGQSCSLYDILFVSSYSVG